MSTVILTFPGHFFQTVLSLRSILEFYPDCVDTITVIADDVQCDPWTDYVKDLEQILAAVHPVQIVPVSALPGIRDCVAGWWRQQLIKLTLDQILPDHQWLVVDGDVIFRSRCDVMQCVPISRARNDGDNRWSTMCKHYVQGLLGTKHGVMHDRGTPVITSAIPFRHLDRDLLTELRRHVESRFGGDFLDLHMSWFEDQTIVADIDPPTRWVMSEWELIECFRQMVRSEILPYKHIGSGYQITAAPVTADPSQEIFLHSYQRDSEIGYQWFQQQGITVDDRVWQKDLAWYEAREAIRLI